MKKRVFKEIPSPYGYMGLKENETKPTRMDFRKDLMKLAKYLEGDGSNEFHVNYHVDYGVWGSFGSNCTDHLCFLVEDAMGFPFGEIEHSYPYNTPFYFTEITSVSEDGKSRTLSTITTMYENAVEGV